MATSMKKPRLEESANIDLLNCDSLDIRLKTFLSWCQGKNFNLTDKVRVRREGSCAQYGMVAVQDLDPEEVLFEVPRSVLLHPHTSAIANILKEGTKELKSNSGWVPLLLALMYEYTNKDSLWRPYLDLCPDFSELDQPMFWKSHEVDQELQGTGIPDAVKRDEKNIRTEYETIALPFMQKHAEVFDLKIHTLELYKKMVAFVMAYSFTEPASSQDDIDDDDDDDRPSLPPMMVAMADILNHIAKNNARLKFGKESLKMVTNRKISKGEEVFNTYGELANWQLLHMYGFAEAYPENIYDTVDIPMSVLYKSASSIDNCVVSLLDKKWSFLQTLDLVSDDGAFILGVNGVLTETELEMTLKVLCMSEDEYKEYSDNEGWSSDEEGSGSNPFDNANLHKLPSSWKQLLTKCINECLTRYKETLTEEDAKVTQDKTLSKRQQFANNVRIGQKKILHNFLELLTGKADR